MVYHLGDSGCPVHWGPLAVQVILLLRSDYLKPSSSFTFLINCVKNWYNCLPHLVTMARSVVSKDRRSAAGVSRRDGQLCGGARPQQEMCQ